MTKHRPLTIPEIDAEAGLTTQEHVYQRLRHAIMVGAIEPGTSLTMRGLAERLGLSPTPIREAVRRLSSEHAIAVLENRRMTVPEMTAARFDELVALRVAVEVHAGTRALPHVADIVIDSLAQIDAEMDACIECGDLDGLTLHNHAFHRTLYTANPDQASMPVVESVWLQLGPFQRRVIRRIRDYMGVDRHKEILDALRIRDATALAEAIEHDIRDGFVEAGRARLA